MGEQRSKMESLASTSSLSTSEISDFNSLHQTHSLSRSIFVTVLVFTLIAVLATAGALVSISYYAEEERSEKNLVDKARDCAQMLEGRSVQERIDLILDQFPGPERFTLIDPEGMVDYDTETMGTALDNHFFRPEMLQAENYGEGVLVRHSDTLNKDTLYVAERLSDGYFIRVSEERMSRMAFF